MKAIVLLGDGMADEPLEELGGKTVLEHAHTPNMDRIAREGRIGMVQTVPPGYHPGSDVANLSVFGYDPASCYSGRSPLEAASMGVALQPDDVAFRLNFVTLTAHYGKLYMEDFSAGHISTAEGAELIRTLQEELGDEEFQFYPGVSYRHLLVWKGGRDQLQCVPPHDITGQSIEEHLPTGDGAEALMHLTNSAQMLLNNHPVNDRREKEGKLPASSIWLWGQGRAPQMPTMQEKFGISRGAVISAVDLIRGIGIYAGLDVIHVDGATGWIDTNYRGKAEAALAALKTHDFVYLHVEAPDEAAHSGSLEDKITAIEAFDREVVGPVLEGIQRFEAWRVLVLPDHPTPVTLRTHTDKAVPFALLGSSGEFSGAKAVSGYDEVQAARSGLIVAQGHTLMQQLLN